MPSDEREWRAAVDERIVALDAQIRLGRASALPQDRGIYDELLTVLDDVKAALSR